MVDVEVICKYCGMKVTMHKQDGRDIFARGDVFGKWTRTIDGWYCQSCRDDPNKEKKDRFRDREICEGLMEVIGETIMGLEASPLQYEHFESGKLAGEIEAYRWVVRYLENVIK